jgi:glycosyltransferase involved in cell wall biosynthesis
VFRVLMCGSIPPEWGGRSGGGVASMHRTLIEELERNPGRHGIEIAGLLPFNLAEDSPYRPPVGHLVLPASGPEAVHTYARTLAELAPDAVLFQHVAHRWAVFHARLKSVVPAVGVAHSWQALKFKPADQIERKRRTLEEAMRGCDAVVFVSESVRVDGERLGLAYPPLTRTIHNPFGREYEDVTAVDDRPRDGWVFVGSLIGHKNPMLVLEAAARCRTRVTFVGDGPESAALRQAAGRLGMSDLATFLGWAAPDVVRETLLGAELMCLPSKSEGFSVAYLEALVCGTPVVGSAVNVAELEGRLGAPCGAGVSRDAVEDVVAAARRVANRAWIRSELRRRARQAFSPAAVTTEYASLLTEVVCRTIDRTRP